MSIKILGGELKGLPLFVPFNESTRPTSVLLKRRLFDSFQNFLDITFLDVCAGTGSVGFEALSRGAQEVIFVEAYAPACSILLKNKALIEEKSSSHGKITLERKKAEKWLSSFITQHQSFSDEQKDSLIIYFDPPYNDHSLYSDFLEGVFSIEGYRGELWVEADTKKGPPESFWGNYAGRITKSFKQGTRIIYIFSVN